MSTPPLCCKNCIASTGKRIERLVEIVAEIVTAEQLDRISAAWATDCQDRVFSAWLSAARVRPPDRWN